MQAPALVDDGQNRDLIDRSKVRLVPTPAGDVRCAVWSGTGKNEDRRGTVVVCHGLSEQIEKYYRVMGKLLDLGFDVVIFDWLGHGRSAPLKGGAKDPFESLDDALAAVMEDVVFEDGRGPRYVLGHSMGGCLACCALHDHPDWFDAAVLCSPMLGIRMLRRAAFIATVGKLVGALPASIRDRVNSFKSSNERFTSDLATYERHQALLAAKKELLPDYDFVAWFNSAVERMGHMRAAGWFEQVATPTLFALAGADNLVDNDAAMSGASRMPNAELVMLDDGWHELLMEKKVIQDKLWPAIYGFLATHAPKRDAPATGAHEVSDTVAPKKQGPAQDAGKLVMPKKQG